MPNYVHISIVTPTFAARVNGGESEGNHSTLQTLQYAGESRSVVSAAALRLGMRRVNEAPEKNFRRTYDPENDQQQESTDFDPQAHWDDDLLGYMRAGNETNKRRGRVEVAPGLSVDPYYGEVLVRSSAGNRDSLSYGTVEAHLTAYQYSLSIDLKGLKVPERAKDLIKSLASLHHVGGSRSRHQSEFRPESLVARVTDDPCPWILNCFERDEDAVSVPSKVIRLLQVGDLEPKELLIGGLAVETESCKSLPDGCYTNSGVKTTLNKIVSRLGV